MTTTATHNEHDTTTERVLFVAFELSEKTWKLGFTTGPGQKPRERTVAARHQARLLQEVAQAKRRSLNLSHFVARKIWRRRGVVLLQCRAHRLQRRGPLRGLLRPMATISDLLQTAIN